MLPANQMNATETNIQQMGKYETETNIRVNIYVCVLSLALQHYKYFHTLTFFNSRWTFSFGVGVSERAIKSFGWGGD